MSKRTKRWDDIVERAEEMGHTVRLVVFAGDPQPGQTITYSTLAGEPARDLDEAMTRAELYLGSVEAMRVSNLLMARRMHQTRLETALGRVLDASVDLDRTETELAELTGQIVETSVADRDAAKVTADARASVGMPETAATAAP